MTLLAAVIFSVPASGLAAIHGRGQEQAPAPIERRLPPSSYPSTAQTGEKIYTPVPTAAAPHRTPAASTFRGEHLADWMNQHRNLTPQQQQNALGQEPGFSSLSQGTQQRMRDRLSQLDAMSPQQRQRTLARTEAMERLTPDQRADVRDTLGQLGALPYEQRMAVAQTFRSLRDLPPEQRVPALNSGRFGAPLDPTQRSVLSNLLRVEPLLPPPVRATRTLAPLTPALR